MKKIFKMFSFFTEKRNIKKFFVSFIFILSILVIPKNTYALSSSNYGTQSFTNDLTSKLNDYFTYNYIVYFSSSNSVSDTTNFNIIPLKNASDICIYNDNGYSYKYKDSNNNYNIGRAVLTNVNALNSSISFGNIFYNVSTSTGATGKQSNLNRVHSSVDLYDCDNLFVKLKSADITYTPPVQDNENCPTCEECQECEEGGPVEVSNFPISNTEFTCLLVLLGVLILMLFLKWCFPMKGGKNK